MQRAYPTRINWENEPSTASPINDTNLNKMDAALYTIDGRVVEFDTSKADQSDLLTCVSNINYNTSTGVFTFTWKNGTSTTVDLNIEKIPVSFSMSPQGVITMTTADGTQYTADVSSLIKTYSFTNSSTINFTVTTDASGNKTVVANIPDGSITAAKLQPNYLAYCQIAMTNAQEAASDAETSATESETSATDSEAWAVGTRNGVPVTSSDETYHNNSKYWSDQSAAQTFSGLSDVNINDSTLSDGQVPVWDATNEEWTNGTISSGEVTEELLRDTVGWTGKNRIPYPYRDGLTKTENGITWTVKSDGSITANGTASNTSYYRLVLSNNLTWLEEGNHIYSVDVDLNGIAQIGVDRLNTSEVYISRYGDTTTGRQLIFNYNDKNSGYHPMPWIAIIGGKTVNNFTFKPMIRSAEILDSTYERYYKSVKESIEDSYSAGENLLCSTVGWTGKNLLNPEINMIQKGVTLTCINGQYQLNGTNTEDFNTNPVNGRSYFQIGSPSWVSANLKIGEKYIVSLENSQNCIQVQNAYYAYVWTDNGGVVVDGTILESWRFPNGQMLPFELTQDLLNRHVNINICSSAGGSFSNVPLKFMIRKAEITDSNFEPYHDTVETGIEDIYKANGILGAKNLLENTGINETKNGITFTNNSDNTITVNGTNSSSSQISHTISVINSLAAGTYIINGLKTDGGYSSYWINVYNLTDSANIVDIKSADEEKIFTLSVAKNIRVNVYIAGSATVSNIVIYPMVRLVSDTDPTYAPYAMTNKELTDGVNNRLPLSGGTITGDLTLKRNDIDAKQSNNGVSTVTYPTTFNILDKNGYILTRKEAVVKPDGNIEAYWYVRNYNSSGTSVAQKGIRLAITKAGAISYTIDEPDKFRTAIGISASNTSYSNTTSGLTATNVQNAIDEIVSEIGDVEALLAAL